MNSDFQINAYVDGSCDPNPGFGGWGVYLELSDGDRIEARGQQADTTNNEMEFRAVVEALELIYRQFHVNDRIPFPVTVHSDSQLVTQILNRRWRCHAEHLRPYVDAFRGLQAVYDRLKVIWVRGHSTCRGNIKADSLARASLH
jgi:ribonuclease HI